MSDMVFSLKDIIRNYLNVKDRCPRAVYWWAYLAYFLLSLAVGILSAVPVLGSLLSICFSLFFIIPWITAEIRRFHDIGKSTATAVIFIVSMFILNLIFIIVGVVLLFSSIGYASITGDSYGSALGMFAGGSFLFMLVILLIMAIVRIVEIVFLCSASVPTDNTYGKYMTYAEYKAKYENYDIFHNCPKNNTRFETKQEPSQPISSTEIKKETTQTPENQAAAVNIKSTQIESVTADGKAEAETNTNTSTGNNNQ